MERLEAECTKVELEKMFYLRGMSSERRTSRLSSGRTAARGKKGAIRRLSRGERGGGAGLERSGSEWNGADWNGLDGWIGVE